MSTPQILDSVRNEEKHFLASLDLYLSDFFLRQETILTKISSEALPLLNAVRDLSSGGKRLRALLAYWGWRVAGGKPNAREIIAAGAAIELFQSAALIHDDIIDRSDTRRGEPSTHRRFQHMHHESSWRTGSESFGISSAIIAGDLCLTWCEQVFSSIGVAAGGDTEARTIFDLMRTEVMAGQYLDILGEVVATENNSQATSRSRNVLRFKSAKYSCEHPLVLGAALAQKVLSTENDSLLVSLRQFGLPLGEAFQMRDDVLGVFGESSVTGKPAGDDLREGKRTLLIALTQQGAPPQEWELLDTLLGQQNLTEEQIKHLQQIIEKSGALAKLEQEIRETGQTVSEALLSMSLEEVHREALSNIASRLLHRAS